MRGVWRTLSFIQRISQNSWSKFNNINLQVDINFISSVWYNQRSAPAWQSVDTMYQNGNLIRPNTQPNSVNTTSLIAVTLIYFQFYLANRFSIFNTLERGRIWRGSNGVVAIWFCHPENHYPPTKSNLRLSTLNRLNHASHYHAGHHSTV